MKLYLVRHAQRDVGPRFDKLNRFGIEQAKRLAYYFKNKKIDIVYCSTNNRAKQTLEFIKPFLKNVPIVYTKYLRQHNVPEEIDKQSFKILKLKEKRETEKELEKRVQTFLNLLKKEHKKDTVLIISHKEVIKSLICRILNLPPTEKIYIDKLPSASISFFNVDKNFIVKDFLIGDMTHLMKNPSYPVDKIQISREIGCPIVRAIIHENDRDTLSWLKKNYKFKIKKDEKYKGYLIIEMKL